MKFILKSLILTLGFAFTFIKTTNAANAADYYVRTLPGLPEDANLKSHAGLITIDGSTNSNIFFWLMHNRHIGDRSRLIIWLNGGNMDGVFLENGPWRINSDQSLRIIDGSWNEYANMLYVDQPVGTGFSYANDSGYLNNITQVPDEFLIFLDKFFEIFPEYSKDEIYIAGESFAGTFIPYIASGLLKRNSEANTPTNQIYNLKGIAIGNGWVDPITQYNAYYTYAINHDLIREDFKKTIKTKHSDCMASVKASFAIHNDVCEELLYSILRNSREFIGNKETCLNQYDIRDHNDSYPSCGLGWPYELPSVYKYLQRADVIQAIHVETKGAAWVECSSSVSRGFENDMSPPSITLLPSILEKINVLLFSGDQDLICNKEGTEAFIKELEWNGAKGFQNLTTTTLAFNNTMYGHLISERNLTYVVIYNASHMVPYDVPVASMDMMYRFMGMNPQLITFPSGANYKTNMCLMKFWIDITMRMYFIHTPFKIILTLIIINYIYFYENSGTVTLIIVICGVIALAAFVYRGKLKRKRSISKTMKAAVESSNSEMDELVIETPLFQSDNVDHFGDSEEEDNSHGQTFESGIRNNQDRYVDDEKARYVDDDEQTRYVDDDEQVRFIDNEEDHDKEMRMKPNED
ncbi:Alpha/Beta hydrolase protein [Gigaspora rosea]|uniref:Pheromone-processing carboxypeptidase KEX1 n=1 Tax=Gigaspora rosea TaxID=44941 RepID=A0A397V020_9GLOM|nr:Alpha/Beta hydrolase protein [Gigaspora rosea]